MKIHHFVPVPANAKPHEFVLIDKHNGLAADFTALVGETDEAKQYSFMISGMMRGIFSWVKKRHFGFFIFLVATACLEVIAQGLGIPTKEFWPQAVKIGQWLISLGVF